MIRTTYNRMELTAQFLRMDICFRRADVEWKYLHRRRLAETTYVPNSAHAVEIYAMGDTTEQQAMQKLFDSSIVMCKAKS